MNRAEFIKQLEGLLQDIPQQERIEAIQYYDDYFEDAGVENEENVLEALGMPQKVAENIKKDLEESRGMEAFEQDKVAQGKELTQYHPVPENVQPVQTEQKKEKSSTGMLVLLIMIAILAFPILVGLFGVLLGLAGILIGICVTWVVLIVSFGAVAISLIGVGIILAVVGVIGIFQSPFVGMGVIGSGLLMGAVGIVFLMLTVLLAWAVPGVIKAIAKLIRGRKSKKAV